MLTWCICCRHRLLTVTHESKQSVWMIRVLEWEEEKNKEKSQSQSKMKWKKVGRKIVS